MDNIDNLIHDKDIDPSHFYEFIRLLRKNSNQICQIITTSRVSYEIPELVTVEVKVEEMDDGACMKLLKNHCPEQDDEFLRELAELCGKVPLAMCVAGPRVKEFKEPHELLQHLQQQPMKTLQSRKTNKYVDQAIKMSYQKCSDEDKKILIRLAVFEGSFGKDAAESVIEKDRLDAANILHGLVSQSLIKQLGEFRYSFHLLIKEFLVEQRNGENEMKKQAMRAELLMVEYYLKLGYHLTMESYSKDGYKESREALKEEAHHVQNVLEICCQKDELILECLAQSEVYTTSARHFSLFVRTIIPASIVNKFLQRCAEIAKEKKQHAIKINFDCLLADNERVKSYGKPDIVEFNAKMEKIQEEFKAHYEDIKEDKSLCAQYYYQYGRYLLRKSDSPRGEERSKLRREACTQLEESLRLRNNLTRTSPKKQKHARIADEIFSLLRLGDARKKIPSSLEEAQKCYEEVIKLSQENLGEHELTASCYKGFGDLLLTKGKSKLAEEKYIIAKKMRDDLDLNASKTHILLLSNLGRCLTKNGQATKAIEILEGARDMAQKLSESDVSNVCKTKVYASLAIAYDSAGKNTDAVHYAKKALELEEAIYDKNTLKKLRKIVSNDV
jgi:tetratricopeptide (TPR) repeat protein